jgi:hypothetical protein
MTRSTDTDVRTLIAALDSESDATREAAIARLIIIGERASARLAAAFAATDSRLSQISILRVFEACGDERAMSVALRGLAAGGDVAVGAVGVLREMLSRGTGSTHTQALDLLLSLASDASIERRVRSAARAALQDGPQDIRGAVGTDLDGPAGSPDDALWEDAKEGRLPDDVAAFRNVIATHAPDTALPVLRRLVEAVKAKEQDGGTGAARWRSVRGLIHQAIALRGSRVALYDLREAFEQSTEPLPSSFLAAIQMIGDESCLEPLATAFTHTSSLQEPWRAQLAHAFQAVTKRERITKKHAALRRAVAKAPAIGTLAL